LLMTFNDALRRLLWWVEYTTQRPMTPVRREKWRVMLRQAIALGPESKMLKDFCFIASIPPATTIEPEKPLSRPVPPRPVRRRRPPTPEARAEVASV